MSKKIYSIIIAKLMLTWAESSYILPLEQSGVRPGYRTTDRCFRWDWKVSGLLEDDEEFRKLELDKYKDMSFGFEVE